MSEIKYINCIGTSFTAGGGFEWDAVIKDRLHLLKQCYGHLDETKTQYNFSWPGQLQKLLDNSKIKVNNFAQSGYGVDLIFRKVYDIANDKNFRTDEHVFVLEFSGFERKEFYYNEIGSYIIANYKFDNNGITNISLAKSYHYDSNEIITKLDKFQPILFNFLNKTFDYNNEFDRIKRETSFFLNWIKQKNIQVVFSSIPMIYSFNDVDIINSFSAVKYENVEFNTEQLSILEFIEKNKLSIKDETNSVYDDFHAGLNGNKLIAKRVYDSLF